jgi:hypothetical protein
MTKQIEVLKDQIEELRAEFILQCEEIKALLLLLDAKKKK